MKTMIYTSGIGGGLFIIFWFIGLFADFTNNDIILASGILLLGLVFFPLFFFDKYRHDKKINGIIESYKKEKKSTHQIKKGKSVTKGWGMNNSPYRKRKSG